MCRPTRPGSALRRGAAATRGMRGRTRGGGVHRARPSSMRFSAAASTDARWRPHPSLAAPLAVSLELVEFVMRGPAEGRQGQGEGPGHGESARAEEVDHLPLQLRGRKERQGDGRAARGVAGPRLLLPVDAREGVPQPQGRQVQVRAPEEGAAHREEIILVCRAMTQTPSAHVRIPTQNTRARAIGPWSRASHSSATQSYPRRLRAAAVITDRASRSPTFSITTTSGRWVAG